MRDVARDAEETDGLGESSFVEEIHAETETNGFQQYREAMQRIKRKIGFRPEKLGALSQSPGDKRDSS